MKKILLLLVLGFVLGIQTVFAVEPYDVFIKNNNLELDGEYFELIYSKHINEINFIDEKTFAFSVFRGSGRLDTVSFYNDGSDKVLTDVTDGKYHYLYLINDKIFGLAFQYDTTEGLYYINFYLLDEEFNEEKVVKSTPIYDKNFSEYDFDVVKNDEGYAVWVRPKTFNIKENDINVFKIDNEFQNVSFNVLKEEEAKELFPETIYEIDNNLVGKYYDIKDEYIVISNPNFVTFYNGNDILFEKEVENPGFEKFTNVAIIKNRVLVIKQRIIAPPDAQTYQWNLSVPSSYSDEILVFDYQGNHLQTIFNNSAFLDLDVNDKEDKFAVLRVYTDGLCTAVYSGYFQCPSLITYDAYTFNPDYDIEGNLVKPSIENPDTEDILIIVLIIVLGITCFVMIRNRKVEF